MILTILMVCPFTTPSISAEAMTYRGSYLPNESPSLAQPSVRNKFSLPGMADRSSFDRGPKRRRTSLWVKNETGNRSPDSSSAPSDTETRGGTERATHLTIVSGDHQEALIGHALNNPLVVEVSDSVGNPVQGVPVHFRERRGQGELDANREQPGVQTIRYTNQRGRAHADYFRLSLHAREHRIQARVMRKNRSDLTTTFTVYGRPQMISVTFDEARLDDALKTLARIAGWNLALPESVNGRSLGDRTVSVKLTDVPAMEALDTILDIHDLSRVVYGDVISVVSSDRVARSGVPVISPDQLGSVSDQTPVTVTHHLQNLDASTLAEQIRGALLSERASLFVNETTNSLVVTDKAGNQRRLQRILDSLDQPGQALRLEMFALNYRQPDRLAETLRDLLPLGQGSVIAYPETNRLLVTGNPSLLEGIRDLVERLDREEALSRHYSVIPLEGYDVNQIADRVNAVLGLTPLPVEEILSAGEFQVENPRELIELARQGREIDMATVLNSASVVPFPSMDRILVFGPKPIRLTVERLIGELKNQPEGYLTDRSWKWVPIANLPLEDARKLIRRMGGVSIHSTLPSYRALLVSSPQPENLNRIEQLLRKVDRTIPPDSTHEIIVYSPQYVDPQALGEDIERYFRELREPDRRERQTEDVQNEDFGTPVVLHAGQRRIILAVRSADARLIRSILHKMDTDLYEKQEILSYVPRYVSVEALRSRVEENNLGQVLYADDSRLSLLVPEVRAQEFKSILEQIDSPGKTTDVIHLRHTRASDLLSSLEKIEEDLDLNVTFAADLNSNSLIYTAPRSVISQVKQLVNKLDRWQKQVFIEGVILEYTLTDAQEFQPRWFLNPQGNQIPEAGTVQSGEAGAQLGNLPIFNGSEGTFAAILNQEDFQTVLSILSEQSESEVLAKPQITAVNNQEASIRVGDEQQIEVARQTAEGVVTNLVPVEAFTELTVTPTITADHYVRMDLTISSDQFTEPVGDVATQTTRRVTENSVLVRDGQTVVIGGLIEEEMTDSEQGVPYLKDVPLFGYLFKSTERTSTKRELIVFLTPHVMASDRETGQTSRRIRDRLRRITPFATNINTASVAQLRRIRELGPNDPDQRRSMARAIDQYRKSNGPFRTLSQLRKVPGLDRRTLDRIVHRLDVRVDVNTVSAAQLRRIRNINRTMAESLVEKRRQRGGFQELSEVRAILLDHGLPAPFFDRNLRPILYLSGT